DELELCPRQTRRGDGGTPPSEIVALDDILHEKRLHKAPEELALMQVAAATSARAHCAAMQAAGPGLMEYQLAAVLHYEFERDGMTWADRKSTRLNSSHVSISYAVFCLKKKKKTTDSNNIRKNLSTDV